MSSERDGFDKTEKPPHVLGRAGMPLSIPPIPVEDPLDKPLSRRDFLDFMDRIRGSWSETAEVVREDWTNEPQ